MADAQEWTWRLDPGEVEEILAAVGALNASGIGELAALGSDSFDLPTMAPKLVDVRRQLTGSRGFAVISGLPVDQLSEFEAAAAFIGIGAHLGSARSQNANGDLLGHVRNVGLDATDPNVRIYQTAERQTFHTDSSDVVGLLCLETAASGGDSLLVSAASNYNVMLDQAPESAAALFDPIATDRRGEVTQGQLPFFTIPVLSWFDGQLTVIYQRQYIESAARFPEAPVLCRRQVQALDMFDELANDPALNLSMKFGPGDMQFVHNHSLLHDRTGSVDKPDSPRHLLRLWLSVPHDRRLPDVFASRFGSVEVSHRGGIILNAEG